VDIGDQANEAPLRHWQAQFGCLVSFGPGAGSSATMHKPCTQQRPWARRGAVWHPAPAGSWPAAVQQRLGQAGTRAKLAPCESSSNDHAAPAGCAAVRGKCTTTHSGTGNRGFRCCHCAWCHWCTYRTMVPRTASAWVAPSWRGHTAYTPREKVGCHGGYREFREG